MAPNLTGNTRIRPLITYLRPRTLDFTFLPSMSDRQKLFYAILASAFIHIAIVLAVSLFWAAEHVGAVVRALPDLSQLTVTIMPAKRIPPPAAEKTAALKEAPPVQQSKKIIQPVIYSDGLTKSSKAPAHAVFKSDSNMVAGSRLPATGNNPLPSIAGPKRDFTEFADLATSMGGGQTPAAPVRNNHVAVPAAPSMPEQSPYAITQVQRAPTPAAVSTPVPTPKPVPSAAPDTLALGKPTPKPAPATPATPLPTPIEQLAKLTAVPSVRANPQPLSVAHTPAPLSPSQPVQPSMQRETTKTKINGGITSPGGPGVDAEESPLAAYKHKVQNIIGSRWNLYVAEHPQDVGEVKILFKLDRDGRVVFTRVTENLASDDLAGISTKAILDSQLPPVPDDLAPMLKDGKLEVPFTFKIYSAQQ